MEKYELKIFPRAEQDLKEIVEYLNELSPQAALILYDEIIGNIGLLEQMPMRCPLVKNTILRTREYRMLMVQNFAVIYVISGETVQIRRILYCRRQYEFLL